MKPAFSFFAIFICHSFLFAQVQYEKIYVAMSYNDFAESNNGSLLFYNAAISNHFILKTDVNGSPLWQKALVLGGTTYMYNMIPTVDNGFLGCGFNYPTFGNDQGFICRLDSDLNPVWMLTDSLHNPSLVFRKVLPYGTDYLIFSGSTLTLNQPVVVTKINDQGLLVWQKDIGNGNDIADGAGLFDAIKIGNDRFAIMYGRRLAVFDTTCTVIWDKLKNENDFLIKIEPTSNRGLLVAGDVYPTTKSFLCKLDSDGNELWGKRYNYGGDAVDCIELNNGNILYAARYSSVLLLIDSTGQTLAHFVDSTSADYTVRRLKKNAAGDILLLAYCNFYIDEVFNAYFLHTDEFATMPSCYVNYNVTTQSYSLADSILLNLTVADVTEPFGLISGSILSFYLPDIYLPCFATEAINVQMPELKLYPDPTDKFLRIDVPSNESVEVKVVNIVGQSVMEVKLNSGEKEIDVSNLSNGIYSVVVSTSSIKYFSRFIKQ